MEDIIDLIATDASPSEVSDSIKQQLFAKSVERINAMRPTVAGTVFGDEEYSVETEES